MLQDAEQPLWEKNLDKPPRFVDELREKLTTMTGRVKYRPLLIYYEPILNLNQTSPMPQLGLATQAARMQRDATLVAIALELYRREKGEWPTKLDQLCPDLLPAVPLDRFDGKPMKYRLLESGPVVYSVGRNKVDDNAQWPTELKPGPECADGDWRLWPTWDGDK
jgi:hypothetical protein